MLIGLVGHFVENGDQVRCGLAGSRLCASKQVFAAENVWYSLLLDRRCLLVVHRIHGVQNVFVEFKFVEIQNSAFNIRKSVDFQMCYTYS